MASPRFGPGHLVDHLRFGYRGVVAVADEAFSLTDQWYEAVARSKPPKDAPWYHVLVDGADHMTYVAERHLRPAQTTDQIEHPLLGRFFSAYDGRSYVPRQR